MSILGLDVGTTTLSAVLLDESSLRPLARRTLAHSAFLSGEPYEKIQDPERIAGLADRLISEITSGWPPVSAIGLTGQMHGVLYTDREGRAVSPLYTWQDGRGNLPGTDGRRFADILSEKTGYPLSSGFGCVTHAHLLRAGGLSPDARQLCTIHAWLGMRLTGRKTPLLHASDAASIGCFDLSEGCFDRRALSSIGPEYFPETTGRACLIGETPSGAKVFTAVGDNQASFLGATAGAQDAVLVNIGTGSQVSMRVPGPVSCPGCEARPLDGGDFLLVGAPLCGGRAYAILEKFLRECAALAGFNTDSLYEKMNGLAQSAPANPLTVNTAFCGTRADPDLRGSITGLTEDNFTPAHLIHGLLTGMADELHGYYLSMLKATGSPASRLISSGNAVRRNPALQRILSDVFALPITLPPFEEEAALGAAYLAARLS